MTDPTTPTFSRVPEGAETTGEEAVALARAYGVGLDDWQADIVKGILREQGGAWSASQVGLVVEAGDAREVHHMAALVGFGAAAINPYMAFESIEDMCDRGILGGSAPGGAGALSSDQAKANYVKAAGKGVLKVMSKMGISTVSGYTAAQVFEAVGLSQEFVDEYFTGTASKLGGGGLDVVAEEAAIRHRTAYPANPSERAHRGLDVGG